MSRALLPSCSMASWMRFLLAPALVFIATAIDRNYQTDFWHHLARGRAMIEQGQLVNQDLFTYTVAGRPLQDANWLTQLLYFHLFEFGGLALVQVFNSLTLAVMMGVLVALCRRSSGSLLLAAGVGAFTFLGLWQLLIIRPQTFSLLLFVLLYAVLELAGRRPWLLLAAPAIMALWANVHGGFPIGLVLIGCFVLAAVVEGGWKLGRGVLRDRRVWAVTLCLAASVAATLANPYGWKVYQYVGITSTVAASRGFDEWAPPTIALLTGKVWMASVLLTLVLFALPGRRPTVREVCLVLGFLPLACGSVRMVAWWLLATAPIIASLLAANLPRRVLQEEEPEGSRLANGAILAAMVAAVVLSLPWLERYSPVFRVLRSPHRTEADLEVMAEHISKRAVHGRVFSRLEWGEYLGWRLAPRFTVFMDGRIEIFPDEVWAEYDAVTRGRTDWEQILDGYQVDYLVLDRVRLHRVLLPLVERSGRWQRLCEAGNAVLYVRRPTASTDLNLQARGPEPMGLEIAKRSND